MKQDHHYKSADLELLWITVYVVSTSSHEFQTDIFGVNFVGLKELCDSLEMI